MLNGLPGRSLSFRFSRFSSVLLTRYPKQDSQVIRTSLCETVIQASTIKTTSVFNFSVTSSLAAMASSASTIDLQALGQNSVKKVPSMEVINHIKVT